jgi:YfiH family protein
MATRTKGIGLAIGTADCGPVLFADAEAGVVGGAHSGWKGAFSGVLDATIEAMETLGARKERIVAVLGPTISRRAYEVGPEFVTRFVELEPANGRYFVPSDKPGHAMFDLPAYIIDRLNSAGVGKAINLDVCTYSSPHLYSYRRMTHRGEPDYGRQMSAIALV